jgi:nitrous oxide reductase accessory protein NosL
LFKLLLVCAVLAVTLAACEKEKQASTEIGAIPKQIIDKATNDINNAEVLNAEKLKAAESTNLPADVEK